MKIILLEKRQPVRSLNWGRKTLGGVDRTNFFSPLVSKPQDRQQFPEETFRVTGNRAASLYFYALSYANDKK